MFLMMMKAVSQLVIFKMYFINHVVLSIVTIQILNILILFIFHLKLWFLQCDFAQYFFEMFHSIFALLHVSCVNNRKHYGLLIDTQILRMLDIQYLYRISFFLGGAGVFRCAWQFLMFLYLVYIY